MLRRLALLLLFLTPAISSADTLVLANGSTMEGIARDDGDSIELRVPQGSIYFPKTSVARIERHTTPLQVYETQRAKTGESDAKAHMALAVYCASHDLPSQATDELHTVVGIDPDNAAARGRLGYVNVGGQWMSRDDQLKALGMVQVRGEWMTPGAAAMLREVEGAVTRLEAQMNDLSRQNADLRRDIQEARLISSQTRPASCPVVVQCQAPAPAVPYYSPFMWGGWSLPFVTFRSNGNRSTSAATRFQSSATRTSWGVSARYPFGGPR